jgi:hypothetical protein
METSLSTTEKIISKSSQILPTSFHLPNSKYYGHVSIGGKNFYTVNFDTRAEALLELRCLEKQLGYETFNTLEDEGFYPERAIIMEEKYKASGRTNSLYTGLHQENGAVSEHNP